MKLDVVATDDYDYHLPIDRVAKFPLPSRENSKLLVSKNGFITHTNFNQIANFLPNSSNLIFNNTKVIPARMHFKKSTGASIEIFLLNPVSHNQMHDLIMKSQNLCVWQCVIGNLKKWKNNEVLIFEKESIKFTAKLLDKEQMLVQFEWQNKLTFSELIHQIGQTPLPPYLNRIPLEKDDESYQTVFAELEGAVAAPTAGLHFSKNLLNQLQSIGHNLHQVTLHVSSGTFQPIKVENPMNHPMHRERIIISRKIIQQLLNNNNTVIAVGTTSLRALESLFWYGVKLCDNPTTAFFIDKTFPYKNHYKIDRNKILEIILNKMEKGRETELIGDTEIMIMPGYQFQLVQGLITNFHQPKSTLMLLIAAFLGEKWKFIYNQALENGYRFLSYGDSCLFLR